MDLTKAPVLGVNPNANIARHPAIGDAIADSANKCAERRRRVLADPDIAFELTLPPLSYEHAEMWNGFVPPARLSSGQMNTSRRRAALIRILRMAEIVVADRVAS